jgi:hypothetical protein
MDKRELFEYWAHAASLIPMQEFSASLDIDDVSPYGVGLFRVRGTTDNCTAEAWARISGRFLRPGRVHQAGARLPG